jgi:D-aspartate ligase
MQAGRITAVIAGGEINGLGVARSLSRGRVPVVILDTDLSRPTMRTRFGAKRRVPALGGEAFIEALLTLRQECAEKPVLFLTQEKSVETVARNFDQISRHYRISMPAAAVMETLMDKARFQATAEEAGFPVPRAVILRSQADLDAARALQYPGVLKPIIKSSEYDLRFKKAYQVEKFDEVERLHRDIKNYAVMILQEWIDGGDDAIYFCLQFRSREQIPVASFAGRKLRSWPPRVGGTASCVPAIEESAALESLTDAFFARIGFFGIGSMEFKKDARTGRFMMIEPTVGRTDFQEEVATLNGVNIPLAAYRYEAGERPDMPCTSTGRAAWAVSPEDRWSAEMQNATPSMPKGVRRYDAVARLNDPLPWLYSMAERLRERMAPRGPAP